MQDRLARVRATQRIHNVAAEVRVEPAAVAGVVVVECFDQPVPRNRDACNAIARDRLIETFHDDDAGYRSWLYANLGGYVVNALRGANPGEPVLHRATCDTITPTPDKSW